MAYDELTAHLVNEIEALKDDLAAALNERNDVQMWCDQLVDLISEINLEWNNRGKKTSLHEGNQRMTAVMLKIPSKQEAP